MPIFRERVSRYLTSAMSVYLAFNVLSPSQPVEMAQLPQNIKPNLEKNIEAPKQPNPSLEDQIRQEEKTSPQKPPEKYGPEWQEKIRRDYKTGLA